MPNLEMPPAPQQPIAEKIRSYLIDGGPSQVAFHSLLTSCAMPIDPSAEVRQQLVSDLADVGVCVDRPLNALEPDDLVGLFLVRKPSEASTPSLPSVGPAPVGGMPNAGSTAMAPAYAYGPPTGVGGVVPTVQPAAPMGPAPPRRWIRRTLFGVFGVLVLAIAVSGAFLVGRNTRLSDQQVGAKLAIQAKHDKRVANTAENLAVKAAKRKQRKRDRKIWSKRLDKATENARAAGYSSGNSVGYSSGNAAGYSSGNAAGVEAGHASGVEDGLEQGSDELTCSDDLDVPLPAC